jgi:hypothetical protein
VGPHERRRVCVQLTRLEAENSKLREERRALEQECQALERDCQSLESEAAAALTEVDAVKFELAEARLVAHKTQASHPIPSVACLPIPSTRPPHLCPPSAARLSGRGRSCRRRWRCSPRPTKRSDGSGRRSMPHFIASRRSSARLLRHCKPSRPSSTKRRHAHEAKHARMHSVSALRPRRGRWAAEMRTALSPDSVCRLTPTCCTGNASCLRAFRRRSGR